jgi:hypothetical protein
MQNLWTMTSFRKFITNAIGTIPTSLIMNKEFTTGNPLLKSPNPTNATTGTIPSGLKNLWTEKLESVKV